MINSKNYRRNHNNKQAGYAALFAILLITAIFTISLVNANLSGWQSQSGLINRNAAREQKHLIEFCQKVSSNNLFNEIDFCPS